VFDVLALARVDSQEAGRRKAARDCSASGFPVVLFGLTSGCDLRKEGVTVTAQEDNQTTDYQFLRLGLSHLTVI
jgi:hypothetical protein